MPEPTLYTLDNGLTVAMFPMRHRQAVHAAFSVQAGSRFETPETNGLSHLLEHMLFRGCGAWSTDEQAETFADLGAEPDAETGIDTLSIRAAAPSSCLVYLLDLMGATVARPRFEDFEAERAVVLEELAADLNDEGTLVDPSSVILGQMFQGHPAGMPIAGTMTSVRRLTLDMLRAHHARLFIGGNAVLTLAGSFGDMTPERVLTHVRDAFTLPRGERVTPVSFESAVRKGPSVRFIPDRGMQATVTFGVHGVPWSHPMAPAAQQLFELLGGDDTSRIWKALRGRRGLAYEVGAEYGARDLSPFGVCSFTCRNEQAGEATRATLDMIARVLSQGVYAHEIARANLRRERRYDMISDEPRNQHGWYGIDILRAPAELLGARVYLDRMSSVSPVDVQAVARRLFSPERLFVSVVGATGSGARAITEAVDSFTKARLMS